MGRAVLLVVLLSGCVSDAAVRRARDFETGVRLTARNVEDAFADAAEAHRRASEARALVEPGVSPWSVRELPDPDDVAARAAVLDGLVAYASALAAVAPGAGPAVPRAQPGGPVSAATAVFGEWLVGRRRADGLRDSVDSMRGHVREVCRLLAADVGAVASGGLRSQLARDYRELVSWQDAWSRTPSLPARDRARAVRAMYAAVSESRLADARLAVLGRSLAELADAHDAMSSADEDEAPELEALLARLLSDAARVRDMRAREREAAGEGR